VGEDFGQVDISMRLSVVVPCFNEELTLRPLHDALVGVLSRITDDFEVLLVDDGSRDNTLGVMRRIVSEDRVSAISR
jgi:glycosyltransferase involved in cell wall biosynthesis